jgi:hypothetical protein
MPIGDIPIIANYSLSESQLFTYLSTTKINAII